MNSITAGIHDDFGRLPAVQRIAVTNRRKTAGGSSINSARGSTHRCSLRFMEAAPWLGGSIIGNLRAVSTGIRMR